MKSFKLKGLEIFIANVMNAEQAAQILKCNHIEHEKTDIEEAGVTINPLHTCCVIKGDAIKRAIV